MGVLDIKGLEFLKSIDLGKFLSQVGNFFLFLFVLLLISGIIIFFYYQRSQKKLYDKKIHWFEEQHGELWPVGDNKACELTIPNTNLQVFYIKEKDMYLPRGTKRMGLKSYWYAIKNNREVVNFTIRNINKESEAELNYDHTDMRYANQNLKDLIKRNYRDKSVKWWKEYKDIISTVIFILVMGISFFFLLGKISEIVDKLGVIADKFIVLFDRLPIGSGVTK